MSDYIYHEDIKALANSEQRTEKLEAPDYEITLDNPLCGDRVTVALNVKDGRVSAEAHQVKGCMLCRASANAIGEAVTGVPVTELEKVALGLQLMLKGEQVENWPIPGWEALGLFQPVANHKSRHDCVLLPFKALQKALA